MIPIKTPAEIATMRIGGQITAAVLGVMCSAAAEGVSTWDLDQICAIELAARGAKSACFGYSGKQCPFPAQICISINDEVVHGIPSKQKFLKAGDIVSFDLVASYDGLMTDSTRTVIVGQTSPEAEQLVRQTELALFAGIAKALDGGHIGDISFAIESHAKKFKLGIVRELVGHGIGRDMHEDPRIPNWGRRGQGPKLKAGMTLAIEPMLMLGSETLNFDNDGWTVRTADGKWAAHWEHTVLVTKNAPEILTVLKK